MEKKKNRTKKLEAIWSQDEKHGFLYAFQKGFFGSQRQQRGLPAGSLLTWCFFTVQEGHLPHDRDLGLLQPVLGAAFGRFHQLGHLGRGREGPGRSRSHSTASLYPVPSGTLPSASPPILYPQKKQPWPTGRMRKRREGRKLSTKGVGLLHLCPLHGDAVACHQLASRRRQSVSMQ